VAVSLLQPICPRHNEGFCCCHVLNVLCPSCNWQKLLAALCNSHYHHVTDRLSLQVCCNAEALAQSHGGADVSTAGSGSVTGPAPQQRPAIQVDQGTVKWLVVLVIACMRAPSFSLVCFCSGIRSSRRTISPRPTLPCDNALKCKRE
jgi:hypothetical protein